MSTSEGSSSAAPAPSSIHIGQLSSTNTEPEAARDNTDPVALLTSTAIPSRGFTTIIEDKQLTTPTQASRKARGSSEAQGKKRKSAKVELKASVREQIGWLQAN